MKKILMLISTLIVAVLGVTLTATPAMAAGPYQGFSLDEVRKTILDQTNKARTNNGLPPLTMSRDLNNVAQGWSEQMARDNRMYHNPNYSSQYPGGWNSASENVAYGYAVTNVVNGWLGSPGHYANIMSTRSNSIGVGVGINSSGNIFYTQNFAGYPQGTPNPYTPPSEPTYPPPFVPTERLAGADRYQTSVAVTKKFNANIPVLYIATGLDYADALSAAPAAAKQGGALLLTAKDGIPTVVLNEIKRLKPQSIVVVGGEGVISPQVYRVLSAETATIRRDAGANRYATSRIVNSMAFPEGAKNVYVATGANFPDALSASAVAGATGSAVQLVPSTVFDSRLPYDIGGFIKQITQERVYIMGGPTIIAPTIEKDLRTLFNVRDSDGKVARIAGKDRYETTIIAMTHPFNSANEAFIATGHNYADALAGAALAGKQKAPMYLSPGTCIHDKVIKELKRLGVKKVTLLGGEGVLNKGVAALVKC